LKIKFFSIGSAAAGFVFFNWDFIFSFLVLLLLIRFLLYNRTYMVLNPIVVQWLVFILLFWLAIVTVLLVQTMLHYRRLTRNITKKDLKTILSQILSQLDLNEKEIIQLQKALNQLKINLKSSLQKIGFVRFNPFSQTGGDQSFSLALLDAKDNGLVISSLHSRETTRLYTKTIKAGKAEGYELSKEESKAIQIAK